ncbi:MAG: alpha/beta hydrolase, partial [Pseudomonadota bacterium]
MKKLGYFLLLGIFLLCTATAATLSNLELELDNSSQPPGDLLKLIAFIYPGENEIEIQITPLLVNGDKEKNIQKLPAIDQESRDENGYAVIKYTLKRERGDDSLKTYRKALELPIPYAKLKIPEGVHQIAYEVKLICQKRVDYIDTLPLSMIKITKNVRTWMYHMVEVDEHFNDRHLFEGIVIGENGQVEFRNMEDQITATMRKSRIYHPVAVNIPGEYIRYPLGTAKPPVFGPIRPSRPFVQSLETAGDDGDRPDALNQIKIPRDSHQDYVNNLQQKPWVPSQKRTLYYATNRKLLADKNTPARYGNELTTKVSYGTMEVNIPINVHTRGNLETPSWWNRADVNKYFSFEQLKEISGLLFASDVTRSLTEKKEDILVFVHGYNNTFEFGSLRLAQLVNDIRFAGQAVLFSWPSEGSALESAYRRDEVKAESSHPALLKVLTQLVEKWRQSEPAKRGKIHLIAHSMG